MICENCGNWNSIDANYCNKCGKFLDKSSFSLHNFFTSSKDFFIIFGVFGALSLYLTSFLNGNGQLTQTNSSIDSQSNQYVYKFFIYDFHFLNLAITASLFLLLLVSVLIIIQAIQNPKDEGILKTYIVNKGSLQRLIFLIPFTVLIIGILGYLYFAYIDEINQIGVLFAYFFGFIAAIYLAIILKRRLKNSYGKMAAIFFVFWLLAGIINFLLTPYIPSSALFLNAIFLFNLLFGQGVSLFCIFTILFLIYEEIILGKIIPFFKGNKIL